MSQQYNRILVTAALPYANGPVHIGHLAGCYLPSDIYVRFQRAKKNDVKFICGTDEHGVPIAIRAMKEGVSPQEVVDKYHKIIGDSFAGMGISFDIFSRTTTDIHRQTSQAFFRKLYDEGLFEERESEQYFDEEKQTFLADRYIVGTCPICSNENAYGDQCEKCGSTLSPEQLINPRSALSNATPVKKATKHWYFPLNQYEEFLTQWIVEGKKDEWKSNVYGQCKSWLDSGLQPRAMTRDSNWGVPVPVEGADGKVLYVWFDAPIGYISATKELLPQSWDDYWKKEDTKLVHFIGKDNIVFHCIIFPAMLKAHGGYILPENVPANEFLNIEGDKVSTSRNWAVWIDEYLKDFPDMQDTLRYVLCANAPETKDNDFTWKDFQTRHNSELVDIFGNFINRAMVLMHKLCDGKVPAYHEAEKTDLDLAIIHDIQAAKQKIEHSIEHYKFRDALYEVIDIARKGNKYLQEVAPWTLSKTPELKMANQAKIDNCLHIALQLTANLAIFANPFIPFTAKKICSMLTVVDKILDWENAGKMDLLRKGYPLRAPELLFRKIEDTEIEAQKEKLQANAKQSVILAPEAAPAAPAAPELKPVIEFGDFDKVELRVGTILSAEKVKKADKLLQLEVDLGFETRTIVSGIALHYQPEEVIGQQVVVVVNLAPRKMRGIESAGMILMGEDAEGKLVFISPKSMVNSGGTVK
ncbi:methionine--tRNA ligase [Taibaiella sp. KBW10]|uniref:methionine--tRNA ligase n=1 Tax=Taibaiella sp. KBW10 TaxID=2153357 RepID=UPI000F5A1E7A|nr:methionine--tRNA ligase [Taibaiella sp. KBW10]RQO29642.1 methionine--tRNA ligase [Taibaiella sp. KBW10]